MFAEKMKPRHRSARPTFRQAAWLATLLCFLVVAPAAAHEVVTSGPVVIDTDCGLDDAVALAVALQHPRLQISAIVATPGAQSTRQAAATAAGILRRFNRGDLTLYRSTVERPAQTPAARFLHPALSEDASPPAQPLTPAAYRSPRGKVSVVVLGPLTSLAAALADDPLLAEQLEQVIIAGPPVADDNWNLRADPEAFAAVQAAAVPLAFIWPDHRAEKPSDWAIGTAGFGPGDAIGERFTRALLAAPAARRHYLEALDRLHDELAVLYLVRPHLFTRADRTAAEAYTPGSGRAIRDALQHALTTGRQARERVLFADGLLPPAAFKPAVRERRERIIAKNGETEWFAQLLLNELHQHVGAYSIIGVKMALRAAELLNAPQHGMTIRSHTPARPPASCLNDGLIVATGSTPGRALFEHDPPASGGATAATFEYNNRTLTLRLKPAYQEQIGARIAALRAEHGLQADAYWEGVAEFALTVWEDWHRRDLFDVEPAVMASAE
jgi:inosine-uridine nucleoside N-ribohydrolase